MDYDKSMWHVNKVVTLPYGVGIFGEQESRVKAWEMACHRLSLWMMQG